MSSIFFFGQQQYDTKNQLHEKYWKKHKHNKYKQSAAKQTIDYLNN